MGVDDLRTFLLHFLFPVQLTGLLHSPPSAHPPHPSVCPGLGPTPGDSSLSPTLESPPRVRVGSGVYGSDGSGVLSVGE